MKIKKQIEDIQKKNATIDNTIHSIDGLITRIRDIELQIQKNEKQSINDYERLIPDCQVINRDLEIFIVFFSSSSLFSVFYSNLITIFAFQLNKQLTLESDYIHPIVVG